MRSLAVLWVLGWAFVTVLAERMLGRCRRGAGTFRATYGGSSQATASCVTLIAAGRCLVCGICGRHEENRVMGGGTRYPGLMVLVAGSSRSLVEHPEALASLQQVPQEELAAKQERCPSDVPFRDLAGLICPDVG